ncbi:hypothetical protein TRFO_30629 [Tritrichomonas foetus]|uniref:Uncharacterized protein n=1 Tax=Tritrichomonas foetus TaxID=1144522 RepID=A0A1J4JU76_9EUKA|nr:hypothetical protein TRFO_30629 [Tritrichomonas foetus]|eukprot:OHT02266.1 hypothetical protein TRFO_30629 [Tritrichomonas foetus]
MQTNYHKSSDASQYEETSNPNECFIEFCDQQISYKNEKSNNYVQNVILPVLKCARYYSKDKFAREEFLSEIDNWEDYKDTLFFVECANTASRVNVFYSPEFIKAFFFVAFIGFCSAPETYEAMLCLKNLVKEQGWYSLKTKEYNKDYYVSDDFMDDFYQSMKSGYSIIDVKH